MFVKLIFKLSSIFYQLVLLCGFQLTGCKTLPNISSFLLLSNQFLTFFRFFISPLRIAAFQLTKCKTSPNISSDFDLSNHFFKKNDFFNSLQKKYALITKNIPCTKCFSMEKSGFRRDQLQHIYRKMPKKPEVRLYSFSGSQSKCAVWGLRREFAILERRSGIRSSHWAIVEPKNFRSPESSCSL